jgi:hypothetical protein
MHRWQSALLLVGVVLIGVIGSYALVIRPWHLHWGAGSEEVAMTLPGDKSAPLDAVSSTRAITIHAPASVVWEWLAQTGQNRGGDWQSYEWLENLFAADMRTSESLNPQFLELHPGDQLYMHISAKDNPMMAITVEQVEPEQWLVLRGGWTFLLEPLDVETTRLVVRYPMRSDEFVHPLLTYSIFEPAHFVMESGMMLGLKANAERTFAESKLAARGGMSRETR